jgi:hypothetical protein
MDAMAPGMAMVPANCTSAPTPAQQKAAVDLVNQTVAAVAPYKDLDAARAAGYVPVTPTGQRVVHYLNYSIARQGGGPDPSRVPALVYVNTPHGAVLSAAMYLAIGPEAHQPPQPGGCLTQWHLHRNLCFSNQKVVGTNTQGSCAAGSVNETTMPMMHVWMTPIPGGPLAPDAEGRAEIQAANQVPALAAPNGVA